MYKKADGQISITEFISPFGQLDRKNRWVRMADTIPWDSYEKRYAEQFSNKTGAPATRFRIAMGTLLIKRKTGHSDSETLRNITENPYMQYLIGLDDYTPQAPFSARSISNFRKYVPRAMLDEIWSKYKC